MGEAVEVLLRRGEAHPLEQLDAALVDVRARLVPLVEAHGPSQRVRDAAQRVQRGEGVLQRQLHVADVLAVAGPARGRHLLSLEQDLPGGGGDEPGEHAAERGLARAALAHERGDPPADQLDRDVVDRAHRLLAAQQSAPLPHGVLLHEVTSLEDDTARGLPGGS